ncbi:MAG: YdeI/OmpD-associated family protein [Aquiluna sp.]|nr:YdeI/OmpD-associated family protein [Aquiluna sp.]MCF8545930.1 YdeI/OmpD-associated family protein [Aquiluna sp.]
MGVSYLTVVVGNGPHASLHIPDEVLAELGANRRAALKVTINGHTYQSTATGVNGECHVVFPRANRDQAGVEAGDEVEVYLELEVGRREVDMPQDLITALIGAGVKETFESLSYSKRKEIARQVTEAKASATKQSRIEKIISQLGN